MYFEGKNPAFQYLNSIKNRPFDKSLNALSEGDSGSGKEI
jgi:hypothetical protein